MSDQVTRYPQALSVFVCPPGCRCECSTGGLCEHDFSGWRKFEDGRGATTVCVRCGLDSMSHDLRVLP